MDLGAAGLAWVQDAYTLVFGGLLLLGARLGDLLGRRRVFVGGLVVFVTASFLIGVAPTGWWLIAARALQGVGAAVVAPSALSLLTASFPEGEQRTRAVAWYAATAGIGASLGCWSAAPPRSGSPGGRGSSSTSRSASRWSSSRRATCPPPARSRAGSTWAARWPRPSASARWCSAIIESADRGWADPVVLGRSAGRGRRPGRPGRARASRRAADHAAAAVRRPAPLRRLRRPGALSGRDDGLLLLHHPAHAGRPSGSLRSRPGSGSCR